MLVVTRSEAVPVLTGIVVAPVTRTIRDIPTEIQLGEAEGLPVDCAASFDNLQRIRRSASEDRLQCGDFNGIAQRGSCSMSFNIGNQPGIDPRRSVDHAGELSEDLHQQDTGKDVLLGEMPGEPRLGHGGRVY